MNVAFMCSMLLCLFISPPSNAVPEIYKKTKTNSAYGKAVWNGEKRPNACGHGNVFFDTPLQRSVCRHVDSAQVCKSHTRKLTVTCVFRRLSCCCKSYVTNAVNRWEMARDDRPWGSAADKDRRASVAFSLQPTDESWMFEKVRFELAKQGSAVKSEFDRNVEA